MFLKMIYNTFNFQRVSEMKFDGSALLWCSEINLSQMTHSARFHRLVHIYIIIYLSLVIVLIYDYIQQQMLEAQLVRC